MSISGHLKDLRKRVFLALLGITLGAVAGWFLYEPVMGYITAPLVQIQDAGTQINFPTIGAALDLKLRVSIWTGLIIASPWWIYQLGAFIMPGLKRRERLYVFIFGAVGVLLFAGGATTGVWLVPRAVEILQSFVPVGGVSLLQADTYVDFYLRLVILFGVSFLIPEILVALNFLGVLSSRNMLRAWRWAVLVAFIFAAIANPLPSPWPMIMQALILVVLYLVAVLISWINERYRKYGRRLRPVKKPRDGGAASGGPRGSGPGGSGPGNSPAPDGFYSGPNGIGGVPNGVPGVPAQPVTSAPGGPASTPMTADTRGVPDPEPLPAPAEFSANVPVPASTVIPVSAEQMDSGSATPKAPAAAAGMDQIPPQGTAPTPTRISAKEAVDPSGLCGVIVLAGGTAKRMGGISKPDVVVGGKTLVVRAIEEIRAVAPCAEIVVVAPPHVAIPGGVARVLEDPPFGGPVAGVAAGFELLRTLPGFRMDGFVGLLTCDAPLAPRLYPSLEVALASAASVESGQPAQFVGGAVPLVLEDVQRGPEDSAPGHRGENAQGQAADLQTEERGEPAESTRDGLAQGELAQDVLALGERVNSNRSDQGRSYNQYLHGVYVAGALAQLFGAQLRDRSVRSLFGQLKLASVSDTEWIGMDVDTWEDAAILEERLTELR